jgi:amino acid adenylation domain-containing protein
MTYREEQSRFYAITDVQSEIFGSIHHGSSPDDAYLYVELEKEGLDTQRLEQSWQQLMKLHATLRSVIGEDKRQHVYIQPPDYGISHHDLSAFSGSILDRKLVHIRKSILEEKRALNKWPLFSINTSRLPGDVIRIHFYIHPIICDLAGLKKILGDWASLYKDPGALSPGRGMAANEDANEMPHVAEENTDISTDLYWKNKIGNLPVKPDLPEKDNARYSSCSVTISRRISQSLVENIRQNGLKRSIPFSIVLLSLFSETIANWSKNQHCCLKTHISGKGKSNTSLIEDNIGEFSVFIPTGTLVCNKTPFAAGTKKVMEDHFMNLKHLPEQGNAIINELSEHRGEAMEGILPVVYTDMQDSTGFGDAHFTHRFGRFIHCDYHLPQTVLNHTVFEESDALLVCWHYNPGLFSKNLMETMFDSYVKMLIKLGSDDTAWEHYYQQLTPVDQINSRKAVNDTKVAYPAELLHESFFRNAEKFPGNPAIITGERQISYNELKVRALQVSSRVSSHTGGETGEVIAVLMEKCPEQVIAVLGILHAGCAYLPISADWPRARIWYILNNANVSLVITIKKQESKIELPEYVKKIILDGEESGQEDLSSPVKPGRPSVSDLAYIIYTSGSSGNPKGVMISHSGAYNTVCDINARFRVDENDRILALSELSFDLSVYDIFGALSSGAAIVIPRNNSRMFPMYWYNLVKNHKVTIWNSVPAFMVLFMEVMERCPDCVSLRLVMLSGDWIPVSLPDRIRKLIPGTQVVSLGGATEASIWSIYYPIGETNTAWRSIPYGKPLGNQSFHVLNSHLEPSPDWVTGKLYIGGSGVAMGYLNNKQLTESSFIKHPDTGEYLYSTGDMGRYLPDGNIEFLGREDFQVKISGFRIELQEIESVINQFPGVKFSIVKSCGPSHNKKKLIAYIVKNNPEESICEKDLRQYLKEILPEYMVPASFKVVESLPLSPNGKIDRELLPSID